MGAEALVMRDKKATTRPEFTQISVTAEKHLPVREVPARRLASYLRALAREGYALIGLEQTRGAVALETFQFPKKTALVLGREREGVDADLLSLLDECVVIKQVGLIRSLNVHVSASIAIHAYAAQHA
jgi:tRNA guanosine-2'-O-methyltransferase